MDPADVREMMRKLDGIKYESDPFVAINTITDVLEVVLLHLEYKSKEEY